MDFMKTDKFKVKIKSLNFGALKKYLNLGEIGTSVQCSSRSAFGRPTGNDVSGHYERHFFLFHFPFLFHFFSVVTFSHRRSARIKHQKTYLEN